MAQRTAGRSCCLRIAANRSVADAGGVPRYSASKMPAAGFDPAQAGGSSTVTLEREAAEQVADLAEALRRDFWKMLAREADWLRPGANC